MKLSDRKVRLRAVWLLILPFLWFARPTPQTLLLGVGLAGVGAWIRGWAAGHIRKNAELTVSGPYAHVRNPLYVGSFLIGAGVTIAGGVPLFTLLFLLFYLLIYSRTARLEAAFLEETFGDPYRRYATAVPLFMPRLLPWQERTDSRFSVELYLRNREWEALAGIAAGFGFLALKMLISGG